MSTLFDLTDPYEIAKYIKEAKKQTPVKVYIQGNLEGIEADGIQVFGQGNFWILIGDYVEVKLLLENNSKLIHDYHMENDRRNSAIPMLNLKEIEARIEPGAIVRDGVTIGKQAVIMMGAVINIGASIGDGSMIDMNAVLGARATIGKRVHVGAGAVVAGVLEPPSATPVIVEDGVLIGANAVILEGVHIGADSVVAAGSVVTEDVPANCVVAGAPAKIIKQKDDKTRSKTLLLDDLRK